MNFSNAHMPWKWVALLSLLVVPAVSFAEEEVSLVPERLPGTEAPAALHLVEQPPKAAPVRQVHPVGRVAAEIGGEVVIAFAGGLAGIIPGFLTCGVLGLGRNAFLGCLDYGVYGFLWGAALSAPVGAWAGGELVGARGTLSGAFSGMATAAVLGVVTSLFVTNDRIKFLFGPSFALVGALVGYELSRQEEPTSDDWWAVSLQPTLSLSPNGAALGLGGRF
jgi:hypothetical protein